MGNSKSSQLQEENINDIAEETGFTSNQIERLWSRFTSLDKHQKGYLTREDFLRIPELAINPLGDRIVHAFFRDDPHEKKSPGVPVAKSNTPENNVFTFDNSTTAHNVEEETNVEDLSKEKINFHEFVSVLARFRPIKKNNERNKKNAREDKLRFAFRMYDLDDDEKISKEELLAVLTMMVGENISEDQLTSIAERTMLEADVDKDNLISFQEFKDVLEKTDVEQKMSIRFLN